MRGPHLLGPHFSTGTANLGGAPVVVHCAGPLGLCPGPACGVVRGVKSSPHPAPKRSLLSIVINSNNLFENTKLDEMLVTPMVYVVTKVQG